jgi:hypothetical protein
VRVNDGISLRVSPFSHTNSLRTNIAVHSIIDETVKALVTNKRWKFVQDWQAFPEANYVIYDLRADPREEMPLIVAELYSGLLRPYHLESITGFEA